MTYETCDKVSELVIASKSFAKSLISRKKNVALSHRARMGRPRQHSHSGGHDGWHLAQCHDMIGWNLAHF